VREAFSSEGVKAPPTLKPRTLESEYRKDKPSPKDLIQDIYVRGLQGEAEMIQAAQLPATIVFTP
jgi:hypothetical protein